MDPPAAGGGGAGAAANANGLVPLPLPQVAAAADHDGAEVEEEEEHHDGAVVHLDGVVVGGQPLVLAPAAPANPAPEAEEEEGHHDGAVVEVHHLAAGVVGDQPLALAPAAPANPAPEAEEEEGHHDGAMVEVHHLAAGVVGDQPFALAPAAPANPVHPQPQDALVHQHPEVVQQLLALVPPQPLPAALIEELPVVNEHGLAPPPPQPAAADEELPVVNEHGLAPPPPQPVPAAAQMDWIGLFLAGVTVIALGAVLVAEIGVDVTTTLEGMTARKWALAVFITIGDLTSLFLTYAPAWKFWGMWRREGAGAEAGAGLATMMPPIAALLSSSVWVFYGTAVPGKNWSMIIINGVGAAFQGAYATVFCTRSDVPWRHKLLVVLLGASVGAVIAIVGFFLLYAALGLTIDGVIGWSGAATTSCTYLFGCAMNMRTRGADGVPAQAWATLANATVWSVCATLTPDWRMLIPHGLGVVLFLVQACQLILIYRFNKPQHEGERAAELRRRLLELQV